MMSDNLEFLLKKQYEFMTTSNFPRYSNKTKEERLSMLCTAIIHEAIELQRLCNYKWWKKPTPLNESVAKEEAIDILHFLLQLFLELGMNSNDVLNEYMKKHQVNITRQQNGY